MRRGKSEITKRPPGPPVPKRGKQVRVPIKKKTAENIMAMNAEVSRCRALLADAQRNLENHVLPLLTERGLEKLLVIEVTEKEPYELVLEIPK